MSDARSAWVQRALGIALPGISTGRAPTQPGPPPLQVWLAAKEAAAAQIAALQAAMRDLGRPVFERIADQGLNGVTGWLQVGLQAALMDAERASGQAAAAARQKARTAVSEFRSFLAADPVVPLLEENPLGVKVSLRASLGRALDDIERSLGT